MICVSRAPLDKLQKYKARTGWSFNWVSSHGNSIPNTPAAKAITKWVMDSASRGAKDVPRVQFIVHSANQQAEHYSKGAEPVSLSYWAARSWLPEARIPRSGRPHARRRAPARREAGARRSS
jgi:Bacterial protein of unknown function (DUF899)